MNSINKSLISNLRHVPALFSLNLTVDQAHLELFDCFKILIFIFFPSFFISLLAEAKRAQKKKSQIVFIFILICYSHSIHMTSEKKRTGEQAQFMGNEAELLMREVFGLNFCFNLCKIKI